MESCSVELFHSFLNLPCWVKHILVWISQHQILVSSLIASLAAWQTIIHIRKQIKQNSKFRVADEKKELRVNVMVFMSEYSAILNDVLSYYKRIKEHIPDGFVGSLWTVVPYLFELDEKYLNFSASSNQLFMGEDGGELLTKLLILRSSRNRLAAANRKWNKIKREGEEVFRNTSDVDEETGKIKLEYDKLNLQHRRYDLQAETLLESSIFAAEAQVRDVLELEPLLQKFLSKKLEDPNFVGFKVDQDYIEWFKENSSDE